MKLIIVSGLSGSGKTVALKVLEDMGFYCIDNLPLGLIPAFIERYKANPNLQSDKVAIGVDARNIPEDLQQFHEIIRGLKQQDIRCETFYLMAEEETLLKRFSETRRKHPLSNRNTSLGEAIEMERQLLAPIATDADLHIDTTYTNVHQLRDLIAARLERKSPEGISILFQSFGFKHGVPTDSDFLFDIRCLPNPHWEPALQALTGRDQPVIDFLESHEAVRKMLHDIRHFLDNWLPQFAASNRTYLTISVGCTGGQHRSVYMVGKLAEHFETHYQNVLLRHRELS